MDIHCCLFYQSEYGWSSSRGHAKEEWNQGTQKCQNSNGSPRNSWREGEICAQGGIQSRAYMGRLVNISLSGLYVPLLGKFPPVYVLENVVRVVDSNCNSMLMSADKYVICTIVLYSTQSRRP